MSLTAITITGAFPTADEESPSQGTVCATRSGVLVNGTQIVEPASVCGVIVGGSLVAEDGASPFVYYADNDTGSTAGLHTSFAIQVDGVLTAFDAVVPYNAAGGTIDLSVLLAARID
jgi:hypothetical protein